MLDSKVSAGPVHLVGDLNVRTTLGRPLHSGGHIVNEHGSGEELLGSVANPGSGSVLLDIGRPGEDGFAVRQALADRSVALPVVMMTGSGDLTVPALKAGAADFMQKPFSRGEQLSVVEQLSAEAGDG